MALDQAANCCVYIAGDTNHGWGLADELLSARAYRVWREDIAGPELMHVINALFFWQPQHCFAAFLREFERRDTPDYYRRGILMLNPERAA